jgi:hypothetical protein
VTGFPRKIAKKNEKLKSIFALAPARVELYRGVAVGRPGCDDILLIRGYLRN